MHKLYTAAILFFSLLSLMTTAQSPYWQWATNPGLSANSVATSFGVSTDGRGNAYAVGIFGTSIIVFGGDTLTNPNPDGYTDFYVVKYNATGTVQWAYGGPGNGTCYGISTDTHGNSYVTGLYNHTIIFGNTTLVANNGSGVYIVKFDSAGNILWAKSSATTAAVGGGNNESYGISADANGFIYVTGSFTSPAIIFGNDTLANAGTGANVFIAKYDSAGNEIWAKSAGALEISRALGVSADGMGNVYITGTFSCPYITFGPYTLDNAGQYNVFVAKYDVSGNVLWAKSAGGTKTDEGAAISADALGDVYLAGYFGSSSITFGSYTLTNGSTISDNLFFVKYDTAGNVIWAKSTGGTGYSSINGVSTDAAGNAYITGAYSDSTMSFGDITITNNSPRHLDNIFAVKYEPSGNAVWGLSAGGIYDDAGVGICNDNNGNVFVTGSFTSPIDTFGDHFVYQSDSDAGNMFVAKIAACASPAAPSNVTGADSICAGNSATLAASSTGALEWYSAATGAADLSNDSTFTTPALSTTTTYYVQDSNACGTSARTAITVTVNPKPNPVITLTGADTLSTGTFASYQWFLEGMTIDSATNQTFIAVFNGNYQVAVTDTNGCSDTSEIYNLKAVGIAAVNGPNKICLYPNPTSGEIYFTGITHGNTIKIYNVLGEVVYSSIANANDFHISLGGNAKGIYFYRVADNSSLLQQGKLVVE